VVTKSVCDDNDAAIRGVCPPTDVVTVRPAKFGAVVPTAITATP